MRLRNDYGVPALRGGDSGHCDLISTAEYEPPNYCHGCGNPFPWAAERIKAAKEHAGELEGLDPAERALLQEAIEDLAQDGPRTALGASRFKKLTQKAGQSAGSGLYKIAVDLASETAKKLLLGS